jgi:hypothetical protein
VDVEKQYTLRNLFVKMERANGNHRLRQSFHPGPAPHWPDRGTDGGRRHHFRSLGDPLWDTSSSQGRLLSTLLAAIAEFERDLIKERTGEGRKRALAKGVKFGRKPKLSEYQRKEALKRRASGETLAEIAKSYAVDISMISRLR